MQMYLFCSNETGILIMIGSLRCLKEAKTMEMIFPDHTHFYDIWLRCKFKIGSLAFISTF